MKKSNALVFIVGGISGGTATLSLRIGLEFIRRGYEVYYLCAQLNEPKNEKSIKDAAIKVLCEDEKFWAKTLNDICEQHDNSILVTYTYEFFDVLRKIKRKKSNVNCYLYVVNSRCLVKGLTNSNHFVHLFGKMLNYLNAPYIRKMYQNEQLIFMDPVVIEVTTRNSTISFPDVDKHIFLLPYDVPEEPDYGVKKRNIIVTMARVSFPFKGYMITLVDIFKKLDPSLNSELWIIGDGVSIKKLEEKIASCPVEIREKIRMFYSVSYDKIGEILRHGKVFVGMGTGVLDAVANGVPSFAVKEYTYDCLGKGLFQEYPEYVCFGIDAQDVYDISNQIEDVLRLDGEAYIELCRSGVRLLKNKYGIEEFYKRLTSKKNREASYSLSARFGYIINKQILKKYVSIASK